MGEAMVFRVPWRVLSCLNHPLSGVYAAVMVFFGGGRGRRGREASPASGGVQDTPKLTLKG